MKKTLSMMALGALLATSSATAGKNVEPVETEVIPVVQPIGLYVGIGGSWTGFSRDCACAGSRKKDSTYGETLRIGYDFNPFFGIEARYLRNDFGVDLASINHYGIYLKPQYHITDSTNIYALAGYGHTNIKCAVGVNKANDKSYNAFSFGAGIEYDLSQDLGGQGDEEEGWGLFADWQNLAWNRDPNSVKVNVVSAGVTYDF